MDKQQRQLLIAVAAVAAAGLMSLAYYWSTQRGKGKQQQPEKPPALPKSTLQVIAAIEERIQRDEGGRGIGQIILRGELYNAAKDLVLAQKVAILTGFPCLMDYTPPTETDGPLGAFAIARALIQLGKEVVIITDECNAECIMACAAGSGLSGQQLELQSFPPLAEWGGQEDNRLMDIAEELDVLVAIERTGPARDGTYRTMRGFDMTRFVAPLERLLHAREAPLRSIGIGDGGNELGMGKALDKILHSNIPNAEQIACVEATDHLIVCSVSNWGGYALAAALAIVACDDARLGSRFESRDVALRLCMPSAEAELAMSERLIAAGARCGITKRCDLPYVDGMPISESIRVIQEIVELGSVPRL